MIPLLLLSVGAGCHDPLTQVVVVFESDLVVPAEADTIQLALASGPSAPMFGGVDFNSFGQLDRPFPLSVGISSGGATPNVSITVQLARGFFAPSTGQTIVVNRSVTDIRFVDEQTMMVVVPLLRKCSCMGTSCPNPGDPACDGIVQPELQPFDPEIAPPSTMMGFSGAVFIPPTRPGGPL